MATEQTKIIETQDVNEANRIMAQGKHCQPVLSERRGYVFIPRKA